MRKTELEYKVIELAERIKRKHNVEDSTVELKAEWPDDKAKAARILGGHGNSAMGEPLIWVIGLDEDRGLVGADEKELSNWWSEVRSFFENHVAPDLITSVSVSVDGFSLIGLCFMPDRVPYVVKNPSFGKPNGGPVQWEVPWREGNSTRTAGHNDLLKLLVPIEKRPDLLFVGGELHRYAINRNPADYWSVSASFVVAPRGSISAACRLDLEQAHFWLLSLKGFKHVDDLYEVGYRFRDDCRRLGNITPNTADWSATA